ncbi:MAG: translation initiation factor IF-2 [Deltaproteobacteria bacterium]|uniref:Translation initiation factor IF-2 n=1 Tax=Candidatus Zymogenus saltonus TaxID=2844893 RepID=A0A9D8PNH3_9DELT|nr:translation initiation factor IF-2 [Candidatus Zymogenus saltonus]
MAKMKVFELARKLKVDDGALLLKIQEMGIDIDDPEMILEPEEVKILEDKIIKEKGADVVEERIKPTVIRRRAKKKPQERVVQEGMEEEEKEAAEDVEVAEGEVEAVSKGEEERKLEDKREIRRRESEKAERADEREMPKKADKEIKAKEELKTAEESTPKIEDIPVEGGDRADKAAKAPEVKGERVLRKRLKTVSKDEITEILRPKVIQKPTKEDILHGKDKKFKRDKGEKEGSPSVVGTAPAPAKKEAEKRRKKKKRQQEDVSMEPQKRSLKKREILIRTDDAVKWDEGKQFREEKKRKKPKKKEAKAAKPAKKVFKKPLITTPKASKRVIKIEEVISVGELARKMGVKAADIIKKLMELGVTTTSINNVIDMDTASLVAQDYEYEVENVAFEEESIIKEVDDRREDLVLRPPVVTIMGHVDHGKTTLLDAIRQTNVVGGELGGITQHIGAYEVDIADKKIVFLDTPGHKAFTTMRARGAEVTDIVVLVVAADDGVMPQTVEAINHAKAAGVPIIVAVNKIDKPEANPSKIKKGLIEYGLITEEMGGDTIFVEISAKEKKNLNGLLEMIAIQAEVLELSANPNKHARGVVIEAKLDRGRGPIATVLIKEGTLKVGDHFVMGLYGGRVRALINDKGENVESAGPSIPTEVLGLGGVPNAGDPMIVVESERDAKEIAGHRQMRSREKEMVVPQAKVTLEDLYERIKREGKQELNLIIKADVQGSAEALSENLINLSTDEIKVVIIHGATGSITESDVILASASDAIVIGFSVRPEPKVAELAEKENVEIKLYNVIYDCVDDIKKALTGMLAPKYVEKTLGRAEVREIFNVPKIGAVAGSYVIDGKILRGSNVRLIRNDEVVFKGKMSSLRRFKEDTKEVASGYECGIKIDNFNDIQPKDIIEAYEIEEVAREL